MVKISIDQEKCAGCGFCVNGNPNLFKIDIKNIKVKLKQKGKLVDLLSIDLSPKKMKEIKEIIKGCPTQAIKIIK